MSVTDRLLLPFDNTFVRELEGLYEPWQAAAVPDPQLLQLDDALAAELGLDAAALRSPDGVAVLAGNLVPVGAEPVAQAYSGHQFGGLSPRLGDGRALLLGEIVDPAGGRHDLHLKGSGRTPFARGGDGKAAVGPMLREYLMGVAMHALGIPTTRALAVVATGERIARDTFLPGAVLTRVAASHLRVGSFVYASMHSDPTLLPRLTTYAIRRHHPAAADADVPALALLDAVLEAQATLIARWMHVGFIHGVMNTDNVTISGETIDYGPCAFMDAFDPATVFSSIDHGGRYAFGNQPRIGQWNLARFAEALLPLIDPDPERAVAAAVEVLETFPTRFERAWRDGMLAKLGLTGTEEGDAALVDDLLELMRAGGVDHTGLFRSLADVVRGDRDAARNRFLDIVAFDAWAQRWSTRLHLESRDVTAVAQEMDRTNPAVIARNHVVEEVLAAASAGDLDPFEQVVEALRHPFVVSPGAERLTQPGSGPHVTYCGT